MTTLAMIFGMLPTALAIGSGAEMRAPMGRGVIGGLITSTLLTLIVVPVMYTVFDDLMGWIRRRMAAAGITRPAHAATPEPAGEPEPPEPARVLFKGKGGAVGAALLAVVLVAGPARAEGTGKTPPPAVPDTLHLTLSDALRMASEQNRDLRNADEYRRWVRGRYVEERAAALPHLTIVGSGARQRDESQQALFGGLFPAQMDVGTSQVGLSQPLFTWGQVSTAIHAAREGIADAENRLDRARQDVVLAVTEAYSDVLLAHELEKIAAQNLVQKERHREEASRKYAEGTATDYDTLAAKVAVDNARPAAIRAANAVHTARDRLRFLLALEKGEVEAEGELAPADSEAPLPDYEAALRTALAHRPELASLGHQKVIARDLVRIYGAGSKPRLDLEGGYGWRWYDIEGMTADGEFWSAGVTLTFPFFDGMRTRGKVAQAKSDVRTLENQEAALRDQIALEVRAALHAAVEAREIEAALSGTAAQAERLHAMARDGYELGAMRRLEVEDALLNLMAARGDLARARRDRLVAETALARVQGILEY
jgi:HAE1 family hydrophobic/amphiphilic exporter-1